MNLKNMLISISAAVVSKFGHPFCYIHSIY